MLFFLALLGTFPTYAEGFYKAGQEMSNFCAACHGPTGVSHHHLKPNLAGQNAVYLAKQLHDFKNKKERIDRSMAAIIGQLSDQDIDDLAAFYSKQPIPKGSTPPKYLARGEQLYRNGDIDKHITACIGCHGPKGTGNQQIGFPVLAGQQAAYTVLQLRSFKDHTRRNDLNSIMQDISLHMDIHDMEAVANYIAGLH